MPFCRICNIEKLEMDMTFDNLCKVCFSKDDSAYYNLLGQKAHKAKMRNKGVKI